MLKNSNYLTIAILIGFFLRLLSYFFFRDLNLDNEWGILFTNFSNYKIIGINIFDGEGVIQGIAPTNHEVFPSIFMPPFYLFLIIFFSFLFSETYLVSAILFFQIILSIVSSYFLYKLLNKFFNKKISFTGLLIFLYFPLNIYASTQISSATLQVFFIILFFYFFSNLLIKKNIKNLILFSIASAILILLRGEYILILFFSYFFLQFRTKNFKIIIMSFSLIIFLVSPYLVRNYVNFEELVITKSFGFNLWKGNNKFANSEGNENLYDVEMIEDLKKINPDKFYEVKRDNIYKQYALRNITEDPKFYLKLYLKKIIAFIFYDKNSTYPNYYSIFHIIPKLILGVFSVIGIFLIDKKNKNLIYFNLCFVLNILVFSLFFILPRYQLGVLPLQIILSCIVIQKIYFRFRKI